MFHCATRRSGSKAWRHDDRAQTHDKLTPGETSVCTWLWIIRLNGEKSTPRPILSFEVHFIGMKVFISLIQALRCSFATVEFVPNHWCEMWPIIEVNFNYVFVGFSMIRRCIVISFYLTSRVLLHYLDTIEIHSRWNLSTISMIIF